MSRPTRAERLRRQDFDGGDPDDTVWYVPNRSRWVDDTTTTKPRGSSYHDDADCQAIGRSDADGPVDTTRESAKDAWLAPCTKCVIDGVPPADGADDGDNGDDDSGWSRPKFFAPDLRGAATDEEPGWP